MAQKIEPGGDTTQRNGAKAQIRGTAQRHDPKSWAKVTDQSHDSMKRLNDFSKRFRLGE